MKAVHVFVMACLIFCWIWSLPLLIIGSICMMPAAIVIFFICMVISCYLQYVNDGKIIYNHWARKMVSSIPWSEWFPCNTLSFKKGIVTTHPHGILCCGTLAGIHFVPKSNTCMCIAPIVFYIPIIGWVVRLLGCIPADRHNMINAIRAGHPLLVVPGGVPEIVMAELGDDTIRFKRHGFLSIAKTTKAMIHIVYVKGECNTFKMFKGPLHAFRVWLSWKLNIPLVFPVMLGWYGSWIPKKVPLHLYTETTHCSVSRDEYSTILKKIYRNNR